MLKSYHFDLGNSSKGPIGFCARVIAKSAKEAVEKLRKAVSTMNEEHDVLKAAGLKEEVPGLEYFEVYFNADKITEHSIDEVNPVEEKAVS